MLDEGIRLSPAQAAHTGRYVTAALSYAHSRGLVHRDIKPANLLFDEHGAVRVADFGLARALAEASWTEPTGALVGTARYAAPEQGTGATLDARADLYALGIVLVESVTGRVPDVADTLIGTLAVRARVPLVAPEEQKPRDSRNYIHAALEREQQVVLHHVCGRITSARQTRFIESIALELSDKTPQVRFVHVRHLGA